MQLKSTITVKLEEEGQEPAVFKFKRPKLNDAFKIDEVGEQLKKEAETSERKKLELIKHNWGKLVENLDSVECLSDENGNPITTAEVKDLSLPIDVMVALVNAYQFAVSPKEDKEKEAFTKG